MWQNSANVWRDTEGRNTRDREWIFAVANSLLGYFFTGLALVFRNEVRQRQPDKYLPVQFLPEPCPPPNLKMTLKNCRWIVSVQNQCSGNFCLRWWGVMSSLEVLLDQTSCGKQFLEDQEIIQWYLDHSCDISEWTLPARWGSAAGDKAVLLGWF